MGGIGKVVKNRKRYDKSPFAGGAHMYNPGTRHIAGWKTEHQPCSKCGHDVRAHDDRNGVNECLIHNCTVCRDPTIINIGQVARIFGVKQQVVERALAKMHKEILFDAEDRHACKTELIPSISKKLAENRRKQAIRVAATKVSQGEFDL